MIVRDYTRTECGGSMLSSPNHTHWREEETDPSRCLRFAAPAERCTHDCEWALLVASGPFPG